MGNYDPNTVREMLSHARPDLCTNENAEWLAMLLNEAYERGFEDGRLEQSANK